MMSWIVKMDMKGVSYGLVAVGSMGMECIVLEHTIWK
jgi:hypothetical protein